MAGCLPQADNSTTANSSQCPNTSRVLEQESIPYKNSFTRSCLIALYSNERGARGKCSNNVHVALFVITVLL